MNAPTCDAQEGYGHDATDHATSQGSDSVDPEDRTGAGAPSDDDVEGHGMPLTPPPSLDRRSPGHGGEITPSVR